ncbi:hypothetical protein D9615_004564 [Tricholomella constricta]|uniref:BSD domain-containing protein n=1 Tax=Tricholomella constricta TaxID=117010 RepID=A0A8H5HBR7_9AGAR|nr:hypothetical protein D9615_004564 [Tricholomella constricta]
MACFIVERGLSKSGMANLVCTAKASYKKSAGSLLLTDTELLWTQDGKGSPSVRVPYSEAASLFCSKDGAAQVRLKLGLLNDDSGHNFTFTAPQPLAYAERDRFKKELTAIISRNRATPRPVSNPPTPRNLPLPSRAPSVSSDLRSTPVIPGNDPASDFRLRKKVLIANPELGQLHRDLVMTAQITEAEFWDGREHLLLAEAASEAQKKGKPGQLVDPRPETVDGGEIKIRITPQLVHDIFDEYPVVAKAYSENVPSNLTEEGFWKRYFQSKLFNAHRASIRSSAAQHVVKDDPIFDKYLEKEDDELEPRRQRNDTVDPFVDLAATQEDHDTTGNEKDITMQPGRQKGALPLIRKFNEHSERLLNSALYSKTSTSGDGPAAKRRRLDTFDDVYTQIEIDDLRDPEASTGIVLEMQDHQRYFEGRMSNGSAADAAAKDLDMPAVIREAKGNVEGWERNLMQLKQERKPGDAALLAMTQNVAARLDIRSRKNDIPDGLFRQMTTCQTAANEFLRQFWSAMYPPPMELQTVVVATPAQRATKAAKMIGYIAKTHEKVDALVKIAQQHGIDQSRVETALKPVLNAVDQAVAFHQRKMATTRP